MLKQEGYDLMGAAFEVYNVLGYGMAEEIYQQSLEVELGLRNIPYQSKADIQVTYKPHFDHRLSTRFAGFWRNRRRVESCEDSGSGTRSSTFQLYADQPEESWLPHQLWSIK